MKELEKDLFGSEKQGLWNNPHGMAIEMSEIAVQIVGRLTTACINAGRAICTNSDRSDIA